MFNYVPVKLAVNDLPIESCDFLQHYYFLKAAFLISRDFIIVPGVENLKRDPGLNIWKEIQPCKGEYEFELAVQLPFFLPSYRQADEYALTVNGKKYIISNRHCEVILDGKYHEYFLVHYLGHVSLSKQMNTKISQLIMSKSLVITKFTAKDISASLAIEEHFWDWLNILNRDIPQIICALRYHLDDESYELPECNDVGKFCPIYVLCCGEKTSNVLRFASHIAAHQIRPFCRFSSEIADLEDFCAGKRPINMCKVLLDRATFLIRSGEISLSCVLACTACETLLTEYVRTNLFSRGLSKSKEKEAFHDLTFSQMLNLLSYFLFDMKEGNKKELIGKVNAIRKLRNDIVHEGKWLTIDSRDIVNNGIIAIKQLKQEILAQPKL